MNVRERNGRFHTAAILAALALLLLALLPLNALARRYFLAHAAQQLLLVGWIPGLLLLADPLPRLWRRLPRAWRAAAWRFVRARRTRLGAWRWVVGPGAAYVGFTAVFWLWHDPALHRLLLRSDALWALEKGTLFGAALLYWWHVAAAAPRLHAPLPLLVRAGYALLGAGPIKLTGIVLLFGREGVYAYPGQLALPGLDVDAQGLGSMLVWLLGGVLFTA
ncbi:MAG: cytochrome c oxidase assembly protein, partial [Anaerolineales bacterium]|nr:cytochrome c oxidase assembly protein [Anaerolineales bacterium]